jgi:hypothetical protein
MFYHLGSFLTIQKGIFFVQFVKEYPCKQAKETKYCHRFGEPVLFPVDHDPREHCKYREKPTACSHFLHNDSHEDEKEKDLKFVFHGY